ncbi:TetR family transcriptional regulator [Streptomyces spiroverticillatus]|uniref:TetR family transcriptional regulator n=1 Tax=Streptomyces finlayi TaxID=67296 RepID=A0A919C7W1_9ACTN|nr:TetR/AcrR family transcriptional regulator C-terminal domain-containing protein [Streptomyces finlayi]GGZ98433.1 TetR family transcriptional regulator [Streptomyces spiroverticillatus]GHC83328.1 TetR family transcriptional regulator [Streptomyces finlayi]
MAASEKTARSAAQPVASVWTRPRPKQREQLSREQIVAEAVLLLDADGIESLSMRKLGTRLGAGATSLYRHVANKDELIELVVDEIYGELEVPAVTGELNWREAAVRSAYSVRAMAIRHPWMASVLGQVGLVHLGPNVLRMTERLADIIATAGFAAEEADLALSAVFSYVIGYATSEAAQLSLIARSGMTEEEWIASLTGVAAAATEELPRLREGHDNYRGKTAEQIRGEKFDYGLQRVLDGLEFRLGTLSTGGAAK